MRTRSGEALRREFGVSALRVITTTLLILSVALVVMAEEEWRIHAATTGEFSVTPVSGGRTIGFGSVIVTVTDDEGETDDPQDVVRVAPIAIRVEGKVVAKALPGRVRLGNRGLDRYVREVQVFTVQRLRDGTRRLAIVQNMSGLNGHDARREGLLCRLLWIEPNGSVTEEYASESAWSRPGLSTLLMGYVTPHAVGYRTNLLEGGWGLVFPALVPIASGVAGVSGLIALRWLRQRPL